MKHYWRRAVTYIAEMPQWLLILAPAESYSDRPMREIVGAMVRGPMKRMRKPMRPEKPTRTWRREATMIEPCSCGQEHNRRYDQHQRHRVFFVWLQQYVWFLPRKPWWINHELHRSVCFASLLARFFRKNCECTVFMRLAHRLHAALPHFYEDRWGRVDKTGVLGPRWALPLWHGRHDHGRGQQSECAPL